jgi:uncharacterized protein (TIGR02246 family)
MDFHGQTSTPQLGGSGQDGDVARAVQTLLDQQAIRDLGALYSMAVDDHDIERVLDCFAPDGSFTRAGNKVTGHQALRPFYVGMMDRYVTTLHTPHSHVVWIDGPGQAGGTLTGHAELSLEGTLMMAAYRYDDRYAQLDRRWVFASRSLQFMYVVPFQEMATSFTDAKRIRWPQQAYAEADFPETFATWQSYS